jgi:decaprenyl-phosphate phosphoribosyltransferase
VSEPLPVAAPESSAVAVPLVAGRRPPTGVPAALALIKGLRPRQWAKNTLVLAAPGAAGVLLHESVLWRTGEAFASLCLLAGAAYLVNDVVDREADRSHPVKRRRPVASGALAPSVALAAAAACASAGLAAAAAIGASFAGVAAAYLGLSLAYTAWLKRVEIFDVAAVAACYVLRALAGGAATGVAISPWFLILVSSTALFIVAGKRSADRAVVVAAGDGTSTGRRPEYPDEYLRYLWMLASGIAIAAYSLWAFAQPHVVDGLAWSEVSIVPFAIGILRYALVVERGDGGQPEEVLLADRPLQLIGAAWLALYAMGVYGR